MTGWFGLPRPFCAAVALVLAVNLVNSTSADEVLFNNGDRLSGTILSADGGKLKIKTKVAGELTVDMKDVKTFTTDEPIEVRTVNKEVITAPAKGTEGGGAVALQPAAGEAAAQEVKLEDIK